MNKSYKYRIYPTAEQQQMFMRTFGCVRFVYNKMLADRIAHYQETGEKLVVTPAAYKREYPWLKEVDSLALVNAQLNLQAAFNNYFRNKSFGFPKYHNKKSARKTYTTNRIKENITLVGNYIRLPKAGLVKIKLHRKIPQTHKIKSVTVCLESDGKYYVSILTEYEHATPNCELDSKKVIGLDYSSPHFYVDSEGGVADMPHYYRQTEAALVKAQRKLSKMIQGSSNYEKQRVVIARLHTKIKNQRKDWQHKESRRIADGWDIVCIEDVDLRALAQRWNLSKATQDNGFGQFRTFLTYKLAEQGKKLITIDKWYPSSKRCSCCATINPELSLDDREWVCSSCGKKHDRDKNAAINIRDAGLLLL